MSWFQWKTKDSKILRVPEVQFLGEQDGPAERELKDQLGTFFQGSSAINTAYLVRVAYGKVSGLNVALCLRAEESSTALQTRWMQASVIKSVASIFASIFGSHEHMDIVFVDERQEAELSRVCRAFYVRSADGSSS